MAPRLSSLGPIGRRSATSPDPPILAYCVFVGAPGSTAATPSGLMLNAKKVNGSLPRISPLVHEARRLIDQ